MDLGFKMNWSIVWVIMGRRGVSSEHRRSSSGFVVEFLISFSRILWQFESLRILIDSSDYLPL